MVDPKWWTHRPCRWRRSSGRWPRSCPPSGSRGFPPRGPARSRCRRHRGKTRAARKRETPGGWSAAFPDPTDPPSCHSRSTGWWRCPSAGCWSTLCPRRWFWRRPRSCFATPPPRRHNNPRGNRRVCLRPKGCPASGPQLLLSHVTRSVLPASPRHGHGRPGHNSVSGAPSLRGPAPPRKAAAGASARPFWKRPWLGARTERNVRDPPANEPPGLCAAPPVLRESVRGEDLLAVKSEVSAVTPGH